MTKSSMGAERVHNIFKSVAIVGFILLAFIAFISSISSAAATSEVSHPSLIFDDISEVPGYQYHTEEPWKFSEKVVLSGANNSLSRDFSDPEWSSYDKIIYRARFVRNLGLAYQITKDEIYAEKAREGLLNIGLGEQAAWSRACSLRDYGLAYDWIQPYLNESDDRIIRNKYATLADTAYFELNKYGEKLDYIAFADYHGKAYPNVGIAGIVLADFTNPDNIPLQSGPDDWVKVGTKYLFVNDKLHSYNKALIDFGFDSESGKSYSGAYKGYVVQELIWWFQIYNKHYERSIFDDYPVSKKIMTSEIWETLPNGYMNNQVTSGNTLETYHRSILNLLDDSDKEIVLNYLEKTEGNDILPYSAEHGAMPYIYKYLIHDKYDYIIPSPPSWTDHLDPDATYQVFRENWEVDSDWLSLITFDGQTDSNRDTAHHDQLSIEYYGDGNLLLADAGENKKVLDKYYGQFAFHHNSIAIENPRLPFPVSEWADSESRGVYKGNTKGITTQVNVEHTVETPWVDVLAAKETISDVIGKSFGYSYSLSSPIEYTRTIIHADNDYFVIFDHLTGNEDWIYRNVFRPSSLDITPTKDLNNDRVYTESEIGYVNGNLEIGGTAYDWLSLPYKSETESGISTNTVFWETTNPYGDKVNLNIFSVPASEVILTKHVGRIAGYGRESEVYSPSLYLKTEPTKNLNRVTALLSDYDSAVQKEAEEIEVNGNGNALKVITSNGKDYFYSGTGPSAFEKFGTDADIVYVRQSESNSDFRSTIINGGYLNVDGHQFVELSGIDLAAINREGNSITIVTDSKSSGEVRLYQLGNDISGMLKDGSSYGGWQFSDGNTSLIINVDSGKHEYKVVLSGEVLPVNIYPKAAFSADLTEGEMPLEVHFSDLSENADVWVWNFGDGEVSDIQNPVHTYNEAGKYSVTLEVSNTNGSVTANKKDYINVLSSSSGTVPEAEFSADLTEGEMPLEVNFSDLSKNADAWLWNFGDGAISEIQNPIHTYNEAGTYTVTLEVSNENGSDTVEKADYITITKSPVTETLDGDFEADVTSGKTPLEVHFTDISSGSPDSWSYDFGDGNSVNEINPVHTYTEAGTYTVTLRVMKGREIDFEEKTDYITVTEEPAYVPKPPVADFTVDVNEAETGTEIHFTDASTENPDTWAWTFGDGSVSREENPDHTYNGAGTYTVTLEVSNTDGSDTIEKIDYITITESPVVTEPPANEELKADFTADVRSGTSPLEVHFTDASSGSPETSVYSFGDGRTVYERNPVHTYDKPGKYTVVMVVTKNNGAERDYEMKSEFIIVN